MENVFIFQTRRIGDFFQAVPLIDYLYNKLSDKKNNKVDILIDGTISNITVIFDQKINFFTYEDIFKTFALKYNISFNSLYDLSASNLYGFLNKFGHFLSEFLDKYDIAVNLNYDTANSLFTGFFKNQKRGFSDFILKSGASNYLFHSVRNRNSNKINIVDIFSLMGANMPAEIKPRYDIINLESSRRNRQSFKINDNGIVRICISIGATSEKRVWSSENYASLIKLLDSNFNCEIVIVGTAEEATAAIEIKKYLNLNPDINVLDLTGKTTLSELIYLIKDFDLIISSDTGTLHIAQIFNIPSVSIFTGNANFYETGPHIENSLVIYSKAECYPCFQHEQCRFNYSCRNDIKPADVFDLILLQIKKNKLDCLGIKNNIKKNIKKGNFSVSFCKHLNSIHFYPMLAQEISRQELASEVLKFGWISVLSEGNAVIDINKVLRCTKKYYKIDKILVKSLICEISFVKTVFENGRHSFGEVADCGNSYFEKFKESVKQVGANYNYLKLACDYFIDELNSSGLQKSFDDIILLLNEALSILKMF